MTDGAAAGEAAGLIRVEVVYALPDRQPRVELVLGAGSTVAHALAAVSGREPFGILDPGRTPVGIFGERVTPDRVLADRDRVEIYRPLLLDPLEARHRRNRAQAGGL